MDTAKSVSNASYSVLKKKSGLHNRGFLTIWDLEEAEEFAFELLESDEHHKEAR